MAQGRVTLSCLTTSAPPPSSVQLLVLVPWPYDFVLSITKVPTLRSEAIPQCHRAAAADRSSLPRVALLTKTIIGIIPAQTFSPVNPEGMALSIRSGRPS